MNRANLVIKQQKSRLWHIGMGFSLLAFIALTYIVGRYLALADLQTTKQALSESQLQLQATQASLELASEKLVMQTQSSQVDNQSNQELVNSVKTMQQQQNELQEELKFYRKIMAPELDKEGLAIDSVKISKTETSTDFHFKITLIQSGKQAQFLKGDLVPVVTGLLNGKNTKYDFRELGTFKAKHFQFQFKYFQNIQGFITIPSGFKVNKVSIVAKTKGRGKKQKAETQIIWQPEESQNYVRQ